VSQCLLPRFLTGFQKQLLELLLILGAAQFVFQATAARLGLRPRGGLWRQCEGELGLQAVGQRWPWLRWLQLGLRLQHPWVRSTDGLSWWQGR